MRITTLCFLLTTVTASAQITIGQNEMPHAGDDLTRTQAVTNPFLNYGATGPNFTWNFANLSANGQDTRSYETVASTNFVYALVYVDLFFNPNRANHATNGVDIPFNQLLPITDPYTFYLHTSSQYKKVGYGAEVAGIPLPITFTQQDVVYELPLAYGNTSSSASAYALNVPNLAYYGYNQQRTNDVDGWGTITTPSGTYDVLRVHTTLAGQDSISLDTLSIGFAIDRPLVHEYKWLAQGFRVPIMQINTTELFGTEIITGVWFYDEPREITVAPPLSASLCAGSTFTLTYDENGSYNPGGFLIPANVFTAQLSDATGSFANPVNLGNVTSTQSGTITVTIPANTPPGTGYRIRVNANSPATTGTDNGFDITIQPGTIPVANATAGGLTTFCEGSTLLLSADTDPGYTYQWLLDGTAIPGATDPDLLVDSTGAYAVVVTNGCGNDQSADVVVTVGAIPVHVLDQPSYTTCQGLPLTITAINQSGVSTLTYQWTLGGVTLPGETAASITTDVPGYYTLYITDTQTGCGFTTPDAQLQVGGQSPVAAATAQGPTTFCDGDDVTLAAVTDPDYTYQWSVDGLIILGETAPDLVAVASGTYTVEVTNSCGFEVSNAVVVNVNPLPVHVLDEPAYTACQGASVVITAVDQSGLSDLSYTWTLDGIVLSGYTQFSFIAPDAGAYAATVTDTVTGCSYTTATSILSLESNPVISVTAQGPVTFCADGSVVLEASVDPDLTYQWSLDGTAITGAIGTSLTADSSGVYTVVATSAGGCTSAPNATTVTENEPPAAPVITQGTDTLYASGSGTFQWFLFGAPLSGATDAFIETATSGDYTVTVTDANGCSNTSDIYTYIATGIDAQAGSLFHVYPNPSNGAFTVQHAVTGSSFRITDLSGRLVLQGLLNGTSNTIDITRENSGVYLMQVIAAEGTHTVRLVKN